MNIEYNYIRPNKANSLSSLHSSTFFCKKRLVSKSYKLATIFPLRKTDPKLLFGSSGVVDQNRIFIEESGIKDRVFGQYNFSVEEYRNEVVVWAGYLVDQWGHFLIESVARLWYALNDNPKIDKYVFTVEEKSDRKLTGNYLEFLQLLGIADKIEIINKPIKFKEVIIPELGYSRREYYSQEYRDIFQRIIDKSLKEKQKPEPVYSRLYLSRNLFPKARRTEFGQEAIDNFFRLNNFKFIYPETISLSQLVRYINNADLIFMASGSISHNMLFAASHKKIHILERQSTVNEIQSDIDIIKSLDVTYIDANYSIYPVSVGAGPFFLAYTNHFKRFSLENGFIPPDSAYLSDKYLKKQLSNYLIAYFNSYGFAWGLEEWQVKYGCQYYEAYQEAYSIFSNYLTLKKIPSCRLILNQAIIRSLIHNLKKKIIRK